MLTRVPGEENVDIKQAIGAISRGAQIVRFLQGGHGSFSEMRPVIRDCSCFCIGSAPYCLGDHAIGVNPRADPPYRNARRCKTSSSPYPSAGGRGLMNVLHKLGPYLTGMNDLKPSGNRPPPVVDLHVNSIKMVRLYHTVPYGKLDGFIALAITRAAAKRMPTPQVLFCSAASATNPLNL